MARLPLYRMTVETDEDKGMDFVGLVDYPAHMKNYVAFSAAPKKVTRYHFNEEKRIVKGVVLSTYQPIYRRDQDGYEYNVYFTKDDAMAVLQMFAKNGYHNNVNLMHDMSKKVEGCALIEMITVNDERTNIPSEFADQNLQKGSVIFSYKINDDKAWKFVKENGAGFSLEGWFKNIPVKLEKNKPKKMKKKTLVERLFGKTDKKPVFNKDNKDKYATATTVDGQTVTWEGAIENGTPMFLVPAEEGAEPILAPAGEYSLEYEGVSYVVKVDEEGLVENVEIVEEEAQDVSAEVEAAMSEMKKDYETKLSKIQTDSDAKIQTLAKAVDDLTEALEKLAEGKGGKFTKASGTDKPGWQGMKK